MTDPTAGTGPAASHRYRRPAPGQVPDLAIVEEQAEFDAVSVRSQEDTTAAAERWRTGLAGLTTVVTGGLLLKGPADAAALDTGWRITLTVLFGTGIAVSIAGFWWALRASAGVPTTLRFDELRRDYGTVRLYRLDSARRAAGELRRARAGGFVAAVVLAAAVLTWWWAPTSANRTVSVTHAGGQSCGIVVDSDAGGMRLASEGDAARITIPWNTITAVKPATSCSPT